MLLSFTSVVFLIIKKNHGKFVLGKVVAPILLFVVVFETFLMITTNVWDTYILTYISMYVFIFYLWSSIFGGGVKLSFGKFDKDHDKKMEQWFSLKKKVRTPIEEIISDRSKELQIEKEMILEEIEKLEE